jgi:hypothetical protein
LAVREGATGRVASEHSQPYAGSCGVSLITAPHVVSTEMIELTLSTSNSSTCRRAVRQRRLRVHGRNDQPYRRDWH